MCCARLQVELADQHLHPLGHADADAQIGCIQRLEHQVVHTGVAGVGDRRAVGIIAEQHRPYRPRHLPRMQLRRNLDAGELRQGYVQDRNTGSITLGQQPNRFNPILDAMRRITPLAQVPVQEFNDFLVSRRDQDAGKAENGRVWKGSSREGHTSFIGLRLETLNRRERSSGGEIAYFSVRKGK